jgi:hypothetical protein
MVADHRSFEEENPIVRELCDQPMTNEVLLLVPGLLEIFQAYSISSRR